MCVNVHHSLLCSEYFVVGYCTFFFFFFFEEMRRKGSYGSSRNPKSDTKQQDLGENRLNLDSKEDVQVEEEQACNQMK